MRQILRYLVIFVVFLGIGTTVTMLSRSSSDGLYSNPSKRIIQLEAAVSSLKSDIDATTHTIAQLKRISGLTDISGDGLAIRLEDAENSYPTGEARQTGIVHDDDLLKIVNELWASGAQALSINGNRMIINSEIRCAGPTIIINKTRVASPYIIQAVGNKDTLYHAMTIHGGYLEYLQLSGIRVTISKEDNLILPAYNGALEADSLYEYSP